ncbi:MAG TPA: hypothetical protein PLY87_20505, partial [Planctomycetaceae bacterium]|nr:hypothetical protein [Planctomycetaceae bacterium]
MEASFDEEFASSFSFDNSFLTSSGKLTQEGVGKSDSARFGVTLPLRFPNKRKFDQLPLDQESAFAIPGFR